MAEGSVQAGQDGTVSVAFDGSLAIVTMNCGDNRFNESFVNKMHAAFDEVLRNPDCKAMATTGAGKFYSNGLDLSWLNYLRNTDKDKLDEFMNRKYRSIYFRIMTFPIPTIALINGHSFAAGALMALTHDHLIMQNARGWWCLNEVHINLRFHPAIVEFLRSKLPKGQTLQEVTVLGRRYTADEAKQAGIVHETCPPQDLVSRAQAWVKKIVPPGGYAREMLQAMKEDVSENILALKDAATKSVPSSL